MNNLIQKEPESGAKLAEGIRHHHEQAVFHAKTALSHAFEAGRLLMEAKEQIPHGEWIPFLKKTGIGERQSQRYMRLYRHKDALSKATRVSDLSLREAESLLKTPLLKGTDGYVPKFNKEAEVFFSYMETEGWDHEYADALRWLEEGRGVIASRSLNGIDGALEPVERLPHHGESRYWHVTVFTEGASIATLTKKPVGPTPEVALKYFVAVLINEGVFPIPAPRPWDCKPVRWAGQNLGIGREGQACLN
ncbi:DUF3102 domain-containing protein [Leptospirillum ferriphilum]|uniref:Uncharacterized protein n=1 Tax=Leptospirillum ferriphilum YSK TaxID=1441628 RepID=A0A059XWI1_9BACT|nr:DUF3102 domain-containing protein [Leptospirillum ferriphilum]AIA31465.1 hypothetical protein Y981_02130 [Leptospirillum ferriphilum YSK]